MTVVLYDGKGDPVVTGMVPAGAASANYYADITIKVSEPILGLPTFELEDDEACF